MGRGERNDQRRDFTVLLLYVGCKDEGFERLELQNQAQKAFLGIIGEGEVSHVDEVEGSSLYQIWS